MSETPALYAWAGGGAALRRWFTEFLLPRAERRDARAGPGLTEIALLPNVLSYTTEDAFDLAQRAGLGSDRKLRSRWETRPTRGAW